MTLLHLLFVQIIYTSFEYICNIFNVYNHIEHNAISTILSKPEYNFFLDYVYELIVYGISFECIKQQNHNAHNRLWYNIVGCIILLSIYLVHLYDVNYGIIHYVFAFSFFISMLLHMIITYNTWYDLCFIGININIIFYMLNIVLKGLDCLFVPEVVFLCVYLFDYICKNRFIL